MLFYITCIVCYNLDISLKIYNFSIESNMIILLEIAKALAQVHYLPTTLHKAFYCFSKAKAPLSLLIK